MKPPRQLLEGADLLAYAHVPESARFTGRLHLYVDGKRLGRVPHLAICRPNDGAGLLLLHCDKSWEIEGIQAWNAPGVEPIRTVGALKVEAEKYYEGLTAHWQTAGTGDA